MAEAPRFPPSPPPCGIIAPWSVSLSSVAKTAVRSDKGIDGQPHGRSAQGLRSRRPLPCSVAVGPAGRRRTGRRGSGCHGMAMPSGATGRRAAHDPQARRLGLHGDARCHASPAHAPRWPGLPPATAGKEAPSSWPRPRRSPSLRERSSQLDATGDVSGRTPAPPWSTWVWIRPHASTVDQRVGTGLPRQR